ncbi:hypothetical protein WJU16_03305 [Chitinophaga pollutisoli]|uniref:Uncharacterized protein n=1 Tax=Chitinophaga pollutisoli TaxID=3133966 RepID=A0ABZ2YR96_9BACT
MHTQKGEQASPFLWLSLWVRGALKELLISESSIMLSEQGAKLKAITIILINQQQNFTIPFCQKYKKITQINSKCWWFIPIISAPTYIRPSEHGVMGLLCAERGFRLN